MEVNNPFFENKKTFVGHEDSVNHLIVFLNGLNKVVSCSFDNNIHIWCLETAKCEKVINIHKDWVSFLLKWDDDVFLSFGDDGVVFSSSVRRMEKLDTIISRESNVQFVRGLRVDDDLFIACEFGTQPLRIYSYSQKKVVRVLQKFYFHSLSKIIKSKKYPNTIYFNPRSVGDNHIIQFDHEKDFVEQRFKCKVGESISSIEIYENQKNEEIVICGCYGGNFCFFNTSHSEVHPFKTINGRIAKDSLADGKIYSFHILSNQFLVSGDYSGQIKLVDYQNEKVVTNYKLHGRALMEVCFVKHNPEERSVLFITCSEDKIVKLTELRNVDLDIRKNSFIVKDLKERIGYISNEFKEEIDQNLDVFFHVKTLSGSFFLLKSIM